jgi:polysaccharide export outer membrane protein
MTILLKVYAIAGILGFLLPARTVAQNQAASALPSQPALAASAAEASPNLRSLQNTPDDRYVIGNADMLQVYVWKEPELTESVPVRSDGKVSLPLIGEIQASGRTPVQLKEEISAKLSTYLTAPVVTVVVTQVNSQKFNILGRVTKPGSYSLSATTTVLDAIAVAGGFLDFAKQKDIYILRRDSRGKESRIAFNYKDVIRGQKPEENITLVPNDTIIVP